MIYECIKRIFGRKNHDCLSAANKPKVVEVILKFARLYDEHDNRSTTLHPSPGKWGKSQLPTMFAVAASAKRAQANVWNAFGADCARSALP